MKTSWQMNPLELYHHHNAQVQEITRMIGTANATTDQQELRRQGLIAGRPPGDEARLRGIPAIGRNVAGAIPGTSPHLHVDR